MSFLASELIQDVSQEISIIGQRVSTDDFLLFINRTNKYYYTNYTMPTATRQQQYLLFAGVNEYPLPSDYASLCELERPFDFTSPNFYNTTQKEFMHWLYGNQTALRFDKENGIFLVNYPEGQSSNVHNCDTYNESGTWSVSGDGSGIATDKQYFTEGTGSIRFVITYNTGVTTLTVSDMPAIDLSSYKDQGFLFLDLDNPNNTDVGSVSVKIGTDSSNYYSLSAVTERYSETPIDLNWGLIGLDFSTKSTVGTPTDTNIVYVEVTINNSSSANNGTYRMDNIFVANPVMFNLPYYSKYNIKAQDGTYKEKVTSTDDTILCPFIANEAYSYKVMEMCGLLKLSDPNLTQYAKEQLLPKELAIRGEFPRQIQRSQSTWYKGAGLF